QDPTSQWARAGLQAREALDEGVTLSQIFNENDNPTGVKMAENFTIRVNPTVGAPLPDGGNVPGNNSYEIILRPREGYNYGNGGGGFNATLYNPQNGFGGVPPYPNAWMRMQRQGQRISVWKGEDGVTWPVGPSFVEFTDDPDTDENELLAD